DYYCLAWNYRLSGWVF
nr:immunoglobulin light chain junction region [Macaca mulatta]